MKTNFSQWSDLPSASRGVAARRRGRLRHAGFTLIEIMVALAILMLMLAIIFVPLNLGTRFFSIGNARAHVQQAAQLTLNQVASDLHQAIYVYPNDMLAGVTTNSPYGSSSSPGAPYYQAKTLPNVFTYDLATNTATANAIVCDNTNTIRVGNTSRIDFILPATTNGIPNTPMTAAPYLVTYYARRLNASDTATAAPGLVAYDSVDNPIVLFRAQCPLYYGSKGNVNLFGDRYPGGSSCSATTMPDTSGNDRYAAWLAQSQYGEPNLEPLADDGNATALAGSASVVGTHLLITPRGMGLLAPHALDDKAEPPVDFKTLSYVPETSFLCEDTNGDGKIDRVRINLALGEFDEHGAVSTPQSVRLSETVDLPNIR